jgi:NADH:ubiquinone oxidoreductase subunit 4 (subunit M)
MVIIIFLVASLTAGLLIKFTRSSLYFVFTALSIIYLFSSLPMFSYRVHYETGYFLGDATAFLLRYITIIVILTSLYSYNFKFEPIVAYKVFTFLFVCSIIVFTTNNMFVLYFFYESSLIPISYAIIKWGAYPERGYSALLMVLFTSILTFPFMLLVLRFVSYLTCTPHFYLGSLLSESVPLAIVFLIILAFAVKLPLYGLHY